MYGRNKDASKYLSKVMPFKFVFLGVKVLPLTMALAAPQIFTGTISVNISLCVRCHQLLV